MSTTLTHDLLKPAAYSWDPPGVELIETHISWVFLAGDYVLKVKRPVDFGFVDFTSLERRHHFCQEEVRLNRRLTADVYLGVVPIVRIGDGFRVDGDGEPVEWGTLMRRLPADRMLDVLLTSGGAPDRLAELLAERLLPFHRRPAPVCKGSTTDYLAVVTENLEQLDAFAAKPLPAGQLGLVADGMRRFIDERSGMLKARVPRWIREGHGDLRAEHICIESAGTLQLFDCVEFNQEIRCADVASDLSFLFMDLRRLGAPAVACHFLDRYRAAGFDLPGDLVRFYVAHRALVRAKVACLEMTGAPPDARRHRALEAADYLNLAIAAALPVSPVAIAISGLSGGGKSTVAAALARALDAPVHSSDAVRKRLAGIAPDQPAAAEWHAGIYTPEWTARTYDELRRLASEDLKTGRPVILDATFLKDRERLRLADLADTLRVPLLIVETICQEEVLLRRIRTRARQRGIAPDTTEKIYRRQKAAMEAAKPVLPAGALSVTVDTPSDGPIDLDPVLQQLSGAGLLATSPGTEERHDG
jgi:uncharacterized protein